jgi:hypothetical protein
MFGINNIKIEKKKEKIIYAELTSLKLHVQDASDSTLSVVNDPSAHNKDFIRLFIENIIIHRSEDPKKNIFRWSYNQR